MPSVYSTRAVWHARLWSSCVFCLFSPCFFPSFAELGLLSDFVLGPHVAAGGFSCHTKCWDFVHFDCPGTSEYDPTESLSAKQPHSWSPHTYLSPAFCGMCGGMLFGLRKQGHQCGGKSGLIC